MFRCPCGCNCSIADNPFPALYSTALLIQLLLSLDRRDIAQTTYQSAKQWGEDSLLIQIMEAWIGMKTVRAV